MDVYVVTAWNESTNEDYVAVFASANLARAAWKKIKREAELVNRHTIYGGVEKRRVIGYDS